MPLISLPYGELRRGLDDRSLSSRALTDELLERIERYDGDLHSYVDVDAEGARGRAAAADEELDAGSGLGPLHGIPVGVKESIGAKGLRFAGGGYQLTGLRAANDATLVTRLREGGAVILGTHAMSEHGLGLQIRDGERATGMNPRHADYAPGGSSSGTAAATAAGLCVVGVGADGAGSVRNPAAACGIVGLKPTEHRLPKEGCHPWTFTMLTAGTFARDVEGAARAFDVLAATTSPLDLERPPRLARVRADDLGEVDAEIERGLEQAVEAFAAAGAVVVDAAPIDLDVAGAIGARAREFEHAHALSALTAGEQYSDFLHAWFANLGAVSARDYEASFATAERLRAQVDAALADADALLLPANPWLGMRWEDWSGPTTFDWYRFCWPFNLSWHPGITIPWSLSSEGLPIAYQLVGRLDVDEELLGVAAWCERNTDFDRTPVLD